MVVASSPTGSISDDGRKKQKEVLTNLNLDDCKTYTAKISVRVDGEESRVIQTDCILSST